jgi:threonine/homoserine/homoserine lactone efflux protein
MYLTEFITIAVAHLVAVASPGPDFAIVLRQCVSNGRQAGLWTSLGIALGILLHVSYCVLGVGVLLSSSPGLFLVVKLLAAVYLVFLGVRAIQASLRTPELATSAAARQAHTPKNWVLTGFLTNGLNPKATLFFLALFSVVIDIQTPVLAQAFYGLYLSLATFAWFALMSLVLGITRIRDLLLRSGMWFERVMGGVLIGLGVQLALSLPSA